MMVGRSGELVSREDLEGRATFAEYAIASENGLVPKPRELT